MAEPSGHSGGHTVGGNAALAAHAERTLAVLEKLLHHDFSNQLVVFQGLVQLLELDEKDRLSPHGQDVLQRLKRAAQKTLDMGRTVCEFLTLARPGQKVDKVPAPQLLQNLQVLARQTFPQLTLEWHGGADAVSCGVNPPALQRAFLEVLRLTFGVMSGASFRLDCVLRRAALQVTVERQGQAAIALPPRGQWESRIEFLLARAILTGCGGGLEVNLTSSPGVEFTFTIPG